MGNADRLAAAAAALAALGWTAAATAQELKVVVSSKPAHSLVAAVMGQTGSARVLVDGNASPHTYAMKPSDAKAVAGAEVLVRISEQLEPFTGKLVKALPRAIKVVSLADAPGITTLMRRSGGNFESDGHAGHGHGHAKPKAKGEVADPHIWLDPANAKAMAAHVAAALAETAPQHAAALRANAEALSRRIDALDAELMGELKPLAGKSFIVFHDAYQYLERRYGLTVAGSITASPEQQPGARRLSELRRKIVSLEAACVFAEPQFEPKVVQAIVQGTKARTGTLDPEGGNLAAGPELYFELMRGLARSLKGCLAGP